MKFLGAPSSGSIAGTTSSHNRAGQYTRNRRSPVQPVGSGRKAIVRANFGAASSGWAALTAAQQASWNNYASLYPVTDALGQSITLTGQQMYISIGAQLKNCGQALPTAVPVSNTVFAATPTSVTAVHAGALTLTPSGLGGTSDFLCVAWAGPVSGGVGFMKTFWQETVIAGNVATAHVSTTAYTTEFGAYVAGQRIFYKLTPVNQYGVTGVPVIGYATVS